MCHVTITTLTDCIGMFRIRRSTHALLCVPRSSSVESRYDTANITAIKSANTKTITTIMPPMLLEHLLQTNPKLPQKPLLQMAQSAWLMGQFRQWRRFTKGRVPSDSSDIAKDRIKNVTLVLKRCGRSSSCSLSQPGIMSTRLLR